MDIEKKELHIVPPPLIVKAVAAALGMLALFLLIATLSELKSYHLIGSGVSATNTISVSGKGEVFAVPDTAEFTATIQETAKDVAEAQDAAAKKANAVIAYLKGAGVDEKDIQTTDYSIYPQYEYQSAVCPQVQITNGTRPVYCPPGKQVLTGFQTSETLTVKVKDTKKAGELLSGVGSRGATNVSGLNFTIADEDALTAQARDKAIAQAKKKADALAKSLGVSIVRIVGFSEGGGGMPPRPMYMSADSGMASKAATPEIAVGQNKITSNVDIVYEIQ